MRVDELSCIVDFLISTHWLATVRFQQCETGSVMVPSISSPYPKIEFSFFRSNGEDTGREIYEMWVRVPRTAIFFACFRPSSNL